MSSPTVRRMCPCLLRPLRPILNLRRLWWGGGYLCLDELGMHKLRRDSTRGGSPRSGHEPHLISTIYNCGGRAGSQWGRRTGGGQWRCTRGCGWASTTAPHGWGPRCVSMGKRMGWTRIIVYHGAYVISSVQTHLICCLTCFHHGVVMHGCVASTRCGHECVRPTRCGHGCVTPTRCGHECLTPTGCGHGCVTWTRCGTPTRCGHECVTLTRCGTPTRCMTLTRLTASMLLTSTYLPTTPYSQFTCVAHIVCMV